MSTQTLANTMRFIKEVHCYSLYDTLKKAYKNEFYRSVMNRASSVSALLSYLKNINSTFPLSYDPVSLYNQYKTEQANRVEEMYLLFKKAENKVIELTNQTAKITYYVHIRQVERIKETTIESAWTKRFFRVKYDVLILSPHGYIDLGLDYSRSFKGYEKEIISPTNCVIFQEFPNAPLYEFEDIQDVILKVQNESFERLKEANLSKVTTWKTNPQPNDDSKLNITHSSSCITKTNTSIPSRRYGLSYEPYSSLIKNC